MTHGTRTELACLLDATRPVTDIARDIAARSARFDALMAEHADSRSQFNSSMDAAIARQRGSVGND